MSDDRDAQLRQVLADLTTRYGQRAIAPAQHVDLTPLPTGYELLDAAIGGGFLPGRLSVVTGVPTSGAATLVLRWLARIDREQADQPLVYLDAAGHLNPHIASLAGVAPASLLLIRPPDSASALGFVRDVLTGTETQALVLSAGDQPFAMNAEDVRRLRSALRGASAAFVWTGTDSPAALKSLIDVQLKVERLGWRQRGSDIIGLHSRVTIEKDRTGGGGRSVLIELRFADAPHAALIDE